MYYLLKKESKMRDKLRKMFHKYGIEFIEILADTPAKGQKMLSGGWSVDQYQVCQQYKTIFKNIRQIAIECGIHDLKLGNPAADLMKTMEKPDYDDTPSI